MHRVVRQRLVLMFLSVAGAVAPATAQTTWPVPAGGNLQAALDAAQPGDTILLQPGATYVGNFVLPVKSGAAFITVRSAAPDGALPGDGTRIDPQYAPLLPILRSPNTSPALSTAPGAHHYRLLFLAFHANRNGQGQIIALGDGSSRQSSLAEVPHDLVIDRVIVQGDPSAGQKRGIALNSAATIVANSYIADIKAAGQDSQAIGGWNGPGPYLISNNYLQAAGENVMFGGADPAIPGLVPSDIIFVGNHLDKPLEWRGTSWTVKNLFELKSAQRVRVEGNLFERNWAAAQAGYAILLKSVNQDGGAPWSVVRDVHFTNNVIRHVSSAINILGRDTRYPAVTASHISFRNNLFVDVSDRNYGGAGRFLLINGASDVLFDHNTVVNEGSSTLLADGNPSYGFVFTNNVVFDNGLGIKGSGTGEGTPTLSRYFPGGHFAGNLVIGANAAAYPAAGNHYPSLSAAGFVDYGAGDLRLSQTSPYRGAGTDGRDPGCDIAALIQVLGSAPAPLPSSPPPAGPGAPRDLRAFVSGATVTLTWSAPATGTPTSYVLEAGTAAGASNAAVADLGRVQTLVVTQVPANVYYVRLRAANGAAVGAPSNEVVVRVSP